MRAETDLPVYLSPVQAGMNQGSNTNCADKLPFNFRLFMPVFKRTKEKNYSFIDTRKTLKIT